MKFSIVGLSIVSFIGLNAIQAQASWSGEFIAATPEYPYDHVVYRNPNPIMYSPLRTNLASCKTTFEESNGHRVRRDVVSWRDGYYADRTDDFTTYAEGQVDDYNNAIPISWRRFSWGDFEQRLGDRYPQINDIEIKARNGSRDGVFYLQPFTYDAIPHPVTHLTINLPGLSQIKGEFEVLSNLVRLNLDNCSFSTLSPMDFSPLVNLQVLSMVNNDFTQFPTNLPQNLVAIDLGLNKISNLSKLEECSQSATFEKLRTINLSQNTIYNWRALTSESVLKFAPNLEILWLHGNSINSAHPDFYPILEQGIFITLNHSPHNTFGQNLLPVATCNIQRPLEIQEFFPSPRTFEEILSPPQWHGYEAEPAILTLPGKVVTGGRKHHTILSVNVCTTNGFLGVHTPDDYEYIRQ